eukprot:CAMPEP_0117427274 /NCGR_PEP_ID=MMETSP0758-20121206/7161_1 /TAXON_ID=63605 /ORGANISM="Percolomonas cosmopolitus, Strain AE-1 (ATCC 50343)" /LENGTH=257 /DNA_ID=CAMNT_0005212825 /DNA_START=177 /DNA_END=950 /DNA_ORIENTATION=-
MSGVSAGALNIGAFGQYAIGQEKEALANLENIWRTIKKGDIYNQWFPGGVVEGLMIKKGIFDSSPERTFIKKHIQPERYATTNRTLLAGTTELSSNRFIIYNNSEPIGIFAQALKASSAVPGVFEPEVINGKPYTDGGSIHMSTVSSAIAACKDKYPHKKVKVDVVLCVSEIPFPSILDRFTNSISILLHTVFNAISGMLVRDVQDAKHAYPEAEIRTISPSIFLPGWFLGFDHIPETIDLGYQDGKAAIKQAMEKK